MSNTTPIKNTSNQITYNVPDGSVNTDTSLTFIGRNYLGYTQIIGENFLHLLENFASPAKNPNSDIDSGPSKPVKGQLWYNSLKSSNVLKPNLDGGLKVFDGTTWIQLGIVKKSANAPTGPIAGLGIGDFYVDTTRNQLYIYTGLQTGLPWQLIGPKYDEGEKTTAEVDLIIDSTDNITKPVLGLYVKNKRVAIVSDREFTPKIVQPGFPIIKQGINLNNNVPQTNSKGVKFWGVSEKAESLIVGDTVVDGSNFLRSDQLSTTKYGLHLRNDSGLLVGTDLSLSIGVDNGTSVFFNKNTGSKINFKIQKSLFPETILTIDAGDIATRTGRVGINNNAPTESLDVSGNIQTSGSLIVKGTNLWNTPAPNYPSIYTDGGAYVTESLFIGQQLRVQDTSFMSDILPNETSSTLGSQANRWSNVWAKQIGSTDNLVTIYGAVIGSLTGDIDGRATGLIADIPLTFSGDIGIIGYNADTYRGGIGTNRLNNLIISLNPDVINNKPSITNLISTDLLLVSRELDGVRQLNKISKFDLINSLPLVPIGTITLWAGKASVGIPDGYRICDGSSLPEGSYSDLFRVIGYEYTNILIGENIQDGISVFKLPNLSGNAPSPKLKYIIFTGRFI
jgi:hypothetical protein